MSTCKFALEMLVVIVILDSPWEYSGYSGITDIQDGLFFVLPRARTFKKARVRCAIANSKIFAKTFNSTQIHYLKIIKYLSSNIYFYNLGKFMFLYINNRLPRTKLRQFSVSYQGSSFFNTLSNDIRNAPTLQQFQFKLRNFLFSRL